MLKPLEKILEANHDKKFISLCAWCECPNYEKEKPFTDKWRAEGYEVSHGMCRKKIH